MRRKILATLVLVAGLFSFPTASWALTPHADGLGACTSSDPPFPYHGSCGTFNNHNTYYGSYGPGFPSPMGWGFCAFEAAHGGWYPAPGYNYYLGTPPSDIDQTDLKAMGWAMSEAERLGWWDSGNGANFDADDIAVAGKLLYDNVAWGAPLPSPSGQLGKALNALKQLFNAGQNITATPSLNATLSGGGTTIYTSGSLSVRVAVSGSNAGVANQSVKITLSGAVADVSGTSVQWVTTDANGNATVAFSVPSQLPGSVSVSASMKLAVPGMVFYDPTMFASDAQILASAKNPVTATDSLAITALGPPTGTLQVHKSVDDAAYYPATGAVFQVLDGSSTVLDTLTVDASGYSNKSVDLQFGDYTLHELTPPTHYGTMADKVVTVIAGVDSVLEIGPSDGDVIDRSLVTIQKTDRTTGQPLPGASFTLQLDTAKSGVADGPVLSCVTDAAGLCTFSDLLPGDYYVVETAAPTNYLTPTTGSWVSVTPGDTIALTYENEPVMVSLVARKFNATQRDQFIPNTLYDLYVYTPVPFPLPASQPADAPTYAGLAFVQRGVTDADGRLTFRVRAGFRWCLHEVWAPKDYIVDPALHCTSTRQQQLTPKMAMAEHSSTIRLEVYKFAAGTPDQGVPNAYYAIYVRGAFPYGYTPAPPPSNLEIPPGMTMWAIAKTSTIGQLGFTVPGGYSWCVQELTAPSNYKLDRVLHCTSTALTKSSPTSVTHIAVAEALAFTGESLALWWLGALLTLLGFGCFALGRRND